MAVATVDGRSAPTSCSATCVSRFKVRTPASGVLSFPLLAVDFGDDHFTNGSAVEATGVNAVSIRVRARNIERLDATGRAKQVFGRAGVELIGRQRIRTGQQLESRFRNGQMQVAGFRADRAVAI